jgi:hypothetical protein
MASFFLKFVLRCGNIENCRKIDHIFRATYTKICVPKRRGHLAYLHRSPEIGNEPENCRRLCMGSGVSPVSTSHFAVIGIPHTARYAHYNLIVYSAQICEVDLIGENRMRGRKWCLCMTQAVGGQWCNRPLSIVHCRLSRFFEYPSWPYLHGITVCKICCESVLICI